MDKRIFDDGRRAVPKVPGINAQPLQPSTGTDSWDTRGRSGQRPHRGSGHSQRFGVRPWTGKGEEGGCTPTERARMALEEAASIAKSDSERRLIANAREVPMVDSSQRCAADRKLMRTMVSHLTRGDDPRKARIGHLILEATGQAE